MIPATAPQPVAVPSRGTTAYLLKLLAGPAVFVLLLAVPLGLSYEGRVALATFACAVVWWSTQPMPWAIASMLPFLVFPAAGVKNIGDTMQLYGQPIFFWIMGTVLMGYAIEKHGLAHRFALGFLSLPGVGGKSSRLLFTYMLMIGVMSTVVSDAAAVAMTIPIGMSIVRHLAVMGGGMRDADRANFAAFITLGTMYASVAGGTATMIGVPHNAIAMSMLERFTMRQLGFFDWMTAGVPVFVLSLLAFYAVLWMMARPQMRELPGGEQFLRAERATLGRLRPNERRVLFVFAVMIVLFTLPTFAGLALGDSHPMVRSINRALPVFVVPPAVMFLLFAIRSESGGGLLTWKDAEQQTPWNVMLLIAGALAMTDALTEFGFVEWVGGGVRSLGIQSAVLPFFAAAVVAASTNFMAGAAAAALYSSIFIPAAAEVGYNPASMAILVANVAIGMVVPWAGATSASAFTGGEVTIQQMIKIGIVATLVFAIVTSITHVLLAGLV
ncbi:MAG: anion permease [Acidobacteria bacterium]|nr:anion permease [Acidobacteriota bacterium]